MAYDGKKKSTQLEVLTVPAPNDLHILGDVSDNGRAKAITQANLELAIASSDNFINELTQNATFIENLTILAPSPLTTKGDIYGYSTEPMRVPVGSNGQRPEADSSQPAGWKWSNAASGGGSGGGGTKIVVDPTTVNTNNDTNENILYTASIPGGTLGTDNAIRFKVIFSSFFLENSPDETKTLRVKYGGTTVATAVMSIGAVPSDQGFDGVTLDGVIYANASASAQKGQAMISVGDGNLDGVNGAASDTGTATVDSTVDQDLVITVQSNISSGATTEGLIVEKISTLQDGVTLNADAAQDLVAGNPVGISNFVDGSVAISSVAFLTQAFGEGVGNFIARQINTDKIAVLYTNGANLKVKVGTLDRGTMQFVFGTAVTISTDTPSAWHIHKVATDKFAVVYNTATDQDVISIVAGTVATNTITLGTPGTLFTAATDVTTSQFLKATDHDTDAGIAIVVDTGGTATAIAYTFSGTVPTVGTPVSINVNGGGGAGIGAEVFMAKVATNKVAYNGFSRAQVSTISGTTITPGSAADFRSNTPGGSNDNLLALSPGTDIYVCAILDTSNEEYFCATISGTTMSFGSQYLADTAHGAFAKSPTQLWIFEGGGIRELTITGNTLSNAGIVFPDYSVTDPFGTTILDMLDGTFWDINFDGSDIEYFVRGMSKNYVGIVQNSPNVGENAIVLLAGTDNHQSGLIAGNRYRFSGTSLVPDAAGAIRAISATEIIV